MFYSWNIAFRIAEICQLKKGGKDSKKRQQQQFASEKKLQKLL